MLTSYAQSKKVIMTFLAATSMALLTACSGGSDSETDGAQNDGQNDAPVNTNAAPGLTITAPESGTNVNDETTITFSATAEDEEDGDLSDSIEWSSNLDGALGTGASITAQLSAGEHTITATVTDFGNESSSQTISLTVSATYGNASVSWNPPVENTDNSTLIDLTGFIIYYGDSVDNLNQKIEVNDISVTSWVIENLTVDQTYYFAITAKNSEGIESEQSVIVMKTING